MIRYWQQGLQFLADIGRSRGMIRMLAVQDIRNRYLGSFLGLLWAFVHPLMTMLIFWFVFEVGFKSMPVQNVPFILWLMTGMIPWFFFADALSGATNSILESAYLVKKVVFRVSILPLIKIVSALAIHLFFVGFLLLCFLGYGFGPTWYWLQLPYYLLAMLVWLAGLAWISAAAVLFLRDLGQIVTLLLQIGFWCTPIFWALEMVPAVYHPWLKLNPCFYLIEGYRNALVYQRWFWDDPIGMVYFWTIALLTFVSGVLFFRKLRPHFADVL